MRGVFFVSCLLAFIYQTTSFQCYTCNNQEEKCDESRTAPLKTCPSDKSQTCFSINVNSTDSTKNGLKKGCVDVDASVTNYCEYYKQTLDLTGSVLECSVCTSEGCNSAPFQTRAATPPFRCYTCNKKSDYDRCEDPNNGLKPTLAECSNLPICVTWNIKSTSENNDGYARGCADAYDGEDVPDDYCDYIRNKLTEGDELLECASCKTEGCNTQKFTSTRDDNDGASSIYVISSIVSLLLACILLTL